MPKATKRKVTKKEAEPEVRPLDFVGGDFLTKEDFEIPQLLEISGWRVETFSNTDGSSEDRPVIEFSGLDQGLRLNRVNTRNLVSLTTISSAFPAHSEHAFLGAQKNPPQLARSLNPAV